MHISCFTSSDKISSTFSCNSGFVYEISKDTLTLNDNHPIQSEYVDWDFLLEDENSMNLVVWLFQSIVYRVASDIRLDLDKLEHAISIIVSKAIAISQFSATPIKESLVFSFRNFRPRDLYLVPHIYKASSNAGLSQLTAVSQHSLILKALSRFKDSKELDFLATILLDEIIPITDDSDTLEVARNLEFISTLFLLINFEFICFLSSRRESKTVAISLDTLCSLLFSESSPMFQSWILRLFRRDEVSVKFQFEVGTEVPHTISTLTTIVTE